MAPEAAAMTPERVLERALDTEMISAEQLHVLFDAKLPNVVFLDVRTEIEFREDGVIPGSVLYPCDHDLERRENTAIFKKDFQRIFDPAQFEEDKHYVLICRSGPRTAIALNYFLDNDLSSCELLGGIMEWKRLGYAVAAPNISAKERTAP